MIAGVLGTVAMNLGHCRARGYRFLEHFISSYLKSASNDPWLIFDSSMNLIDQVVMVTNNPNTSKSGLKILYVNDAFCRVTKYSKDDVIGMSPSILQGTKTSSHTLMQIRSAVKAERSICCDLLNYTKDQKEHWVELNLSPLSADGISCDYFIGRSFDITLSNKSRGIEAENGQSLEIILESLNLGYWDHDLRTGQTNRSLISDQLYGYKNFQQDFSYEVFLSNIFEEDRGKVNSAFNYSLVHQCDYDVEFRCEWPDGSLHWLSSKGRVITDEKNHVVRMVGVQENIDEKKRTSEKMYNLAYFDSLTQLPNRAAFGEKMDVLSLNKGREHKYCAVVFIDLDDFKSVNDTLGHDIGDMLLVNVAERVRESVPSGSMIARLGGDEFVILIESLSDSLDCATKIVESLVTIIQNAFLQPFYVIGNEIYSGASLGISLFNGYSNNKSEIFKQADLALYEAKARGKNTYRFFDQKLELELVKKKLMENELRQAIVNQDFFLVYQPKVRPNCKTVGVEALIRWQHPVRGMISPGDFIPLAESTGLIVPIGELVLKQAVAFIEQWHALGIPDDCTLSVNISPVQFSHASFVEKFSSVLHNSNFQKSRLMLEITENTVIENLAESLIKINIVKEQGVTFSLDDFGSGFSSLSYLKALPVDEIKIDKSFIDDVMTDQRNEVVLSAIIEIASKLGLSLVVEGVETIEPVELLNTLGASIYQGFYFSKPLLEADVIDFILSGQ